MLCRNYRGISLSLIGKLYVGILIDKVQRLTGGLIHDERRDLRAGSGCVDQIFTLKQIVEKAREKCSVYGFYGFGEGIYDREAHTVKR